MATETLSRTTPAPRAESSSAALTLAALGVVYGDIGTSPLYALRECFFGPHAVAASRANVLGVLSLVFWTLVVVVTLKYLVYVLRADNRGEGGILALMALVRRKVHGRVRLAVLALGLFGAALLYADGILTPAISVLSAVEGLVVVRPALSPLVVPATLAILVLLFAFQRRGTAGVGAVFGPIMLLWFAGLAVLGLLGIARGPAVLAAVNPAYALRFLVEGGGASFVVLGAVFLVATGGEALYADLGHFGVRPIRAGWFGVAGLSLLLNYFGQGALLLADPSSARNPFYLLAPEPLRVPLLGLATLAAIIASQAIISGAFSLTRQAVQLGYLPRTVIVHTSAHQIGQVYVPTVNWLLALAVGALVLAFRTSSNVASAYGVALTTTMLITTLLAAVVARRIWHWPLAAVALVTAVLLVPDLAFFSAAVLKVPDGGWLPLAIGALLVTVMTTWKQGRGALARTLSTRLLPVERVLDDLERRRIPRVPGLAVYLTGDSEGTPIAFLHNLKINGAVHEHNLFLTLLGVETPHVEPERRLDVRELRPGFHRVVARFGFMEDPDVPALMRTGELAALGVDPARAVYILSRNELLPAKTSRLSPWRRDLFMYLSRNSAGAGRFFQIPPNRVLEIGMRVEV